MVWFREQSAWNKGFGCEVMDLLCAIACESHRRLYGEPNVIK